MPPPVAGLTFRGAPPLICQAFSIIDVETAEERATRPHPSIVPPLYFDKRVDSFFVEVQGGNMSDQRIDLPQGSLEPLILKTLALEQQHGWAISERIQQISRDVLQVQQGSLYPALHRLERRGWCI